MNKWGLAILSILFGLSVINLFLSNDPITQWPNNLSFFELSALPARRSLGVGGSFQL